MKKFIRILCVAMILTLFGCGSSDAATKETVVETKSEEDLLKEEVTQFACNYLMNYIDYLKNPYSIEIHNVHCLKKTSNEVFFTVTYSAENSVGGKVTKEIGCTRISPLKLDETDYIDNVMADYYYYHEEDGSYAKEDANSFKLDADYIQEYILENY